MFTKKITLLILVAFLSTGMKSQKNYLTISGQAGSVVNSQQDRKLGLGGSAAWLHQDDFIFRREKNYLSLTLKIFNNPYKDGKFISSIFNQADDRFNYVAALAGYRTSFQDADNGLFIEPRLGVGVFAGSKAAFMFSPMIGYQLNRLDIGAYCDMAFSYRTFATGTNNFFTVGISVGYGIPL